MNFAIIGFGGLGKVHFNNVPLINEAVGDVKLTAICDVEESAFKMATGTNLGDGKDLGDLSEYNLYTDVDELFEKEQLDFVITALPTYLHEKIAVQAMEKGIHVFSEKPIAINREQAENMIKKSKECNVKLMIGQCLRFAPLYTEIRNIIKSEKYGKLIRGDFFRLSLTPSWSWQNWMLDETKSGGAALDLHVHDVDFINWTLGLPDSVTAVATNHKTKYDSVSAVLRYDETLVMITGDWGYADTFPFTTSFNLRFEKASIVQNVNGVMVYPCTGEPFRLETANENMYANEVIEFIKCIREDRQSEINPPEDSLSTLNIVLAEKLSADINKTIEF